MSEATAAVAAPNFVGSEERDSQVHEQTAADWLGVLERHAHERAGNAAVTQRRLDGHYESVDYGQLLGRVRGYARLFELTTQPGQIIPFCLARGTESIAAMFGALIAQRAFCTINPKLRLPQLEHILTRLRSPITLIDGPGMASLRGERIATSPLTRTTWYVTEGAPLTRAAQRTLYELAASTTVVQLGPATWEGSVQPQAAVPSVSPADASRVGCCLFTSGSTGIPKGVLISARDLRERSAVEVDWLGLRGSDVLLNLLPFSFDVGLNQVLSSALVGAELVLLESWLPADVLAAVAERGVTGIAAVPSIWTDFLSKGRAFDRASAHRSLRFLTVSGGDLSPAQHERLPGIADGAAIFKTYGQTEAFRIASLRPEDYASRPLSIGRALPGGALHVLRADGSAAAPGELGEVVHTGVGTMLGYLGDDGQPQPSDGSAAAPKLRPLPHRSEHDESSLAVFTGDLGQLDAQGFLQLAGRRDDLVKIAGNRVYPAEVKAQLTLLADVATAEVVALRGERSLLVAYVVPRGGAALEAEPLRRQLQERVPSYMVPERLFVCDELPRTASGKPDRARLLEWAIGALATAASDTPDSSRTVRPHS